MRLPQAQLSPEHHPKSPLLPSTLQVRALRQRSGLHARARSAWRGRSGPGTGPISGVAAWDCHCCCLPGRQWVCPSGSANGLSLPTPPRENPFLEGSPGLALLSLRWLGEHGERCTCVQGNPSQLHPMHRGDPHRCVCAPPLPEAEGRARDFPLPPLHPSFYHAQGDPSIHPLPHLQGIPFHPSSSLLVHRGVSLLPYPSLHGGYPSVFAPLPPPNAHSGGGHQSLPLPGPLSPTPSEPAAPTPSHLPGGVAG